MTRKVHAFRNLGSASTGSRCKVERYECQGCGASYADEATALNCELHHQSVLKTIKGEPLVSVPLNTDHASAAAAMLRKYADRLDRGASPSDLGPDVELLGRVMAHRT